MISKQLSAYLRVSKNGGMPTEQADLIADVVEHAQSLGYFEERMVLQPLVFVRNEAGVREASGVFGIKYQISEDFEVFQFVGGVAASIDKCADSVTARASANRHWFKEMAKVLNYQYTYQAKDHIIEKCDGIEFNWSEVSPPNDECSYTHIKCEFYRIEWKSWKEFDSPVLYSLPDEEFIDSFYDVDGAKKGAIVHTKKVIEKWLSLISNV